MLARSLKNAILNVYLQTRLITYVLVQCPILCSFKISILINVSYKHVRYMFRFTSFFKNPASNYFLATRKYYLTMAMLINWACACMYVAKKPPYSKHAYRNIAIYKFYLCMYYICLTSSLKNPCQEQSNMNCENCYICIHNYKVNCVCKWR